jgi:two-component system sensor histidine kinase/response regulator
MSSENNDIPVNILIVDDRDENIYSLENLLIQEGVTINFLRATSGNEALKIAYKTDLALIMLDVQMPGMDGYEVATILKQKKTTQSIPIIFVTALIHESKYVAEGYSKGAVDYLFKPLDPFITRSKVNSFISIYLQQKKLEGDYKNLEEIVQRRTVDLMRSNEELKVEINKRLVAEEQLKKYNEKLLALNKDLDQFVYIASHDLKLPVANLEGLVTALREELDVEGLSCANIIDMIDISTGQMRDTIDGLIGIIRSQQLDNGAIEPVNCYEVLEEVKISISELIKTHSATISTDIDSKMDFNFNRTCFKSVLFNLISNSIKYKHPDRSPKIKINFLITDNYKILTVRDNGVGMTQEEQSRLFKVFSRLHKDEESEGTGLGLYNLKKMLERYDACIEVKSEKGKGSEFRVLFPLEYEDLVK